MDRRKKISLIILAAICIAILFFLAKVIKNRYFPPEKSAGQEQLPISYGQNGTEIEEGQTPDIPGEFLNEEDKKEDLEEEEEIKEDEEGEEVGEKETFLKIEKSDCDNKCKNFSKNGNDLNYCQKVCGIKEIKKVNSEEECEDKEGLEEDYCLFDLAVSKTDFLICEKIEDSSISKTCKNRITENIIDEQTGLE